MKKYTSVFMLLTRSVICKAALLFTLMTGIETILFFTRLKQAFHPDNTEFYEKSLDLILENSYLLYLFLAGFFLLSILLATNGMERKTKLSYTLKRLNISTRQIFFLQILCNLIFYFIFWIGQIFIIFLFSQIYFRTGTSDFYSNQTLLITFYDNHFLHSLLPLEETSLTIRNLLSLPALAVESALFSLQSRRNRREWPFFLFLFLFLLCFYSPLGSITGNIIIIVASMAVYIRAIYLNFEKGGLS